MYCKTALFTKRQTVFILALCLFLTTNGVQAAAQKSAGTVRISNVALMPFLLGGSDSRKEKALEKTLDCQLRGLCYLEEALQPGAEQSLTVLVQTELKKHLGDKVVPQTQVESAYNLLYRGEEKTPRDLAMELGRNLNADYVMVGLVWRYQERKGSPMGVESPASVAFSLFLVKVENGSLAWKSTFDKTQTSLSENLFDAPMFFKKGLKWLTAEELAAYGAGGVIRNMPAD